MSKRIILLGDSVIDNGTYVKSGEPDVAKQLLDLMPGYQVERRAVDGSVTADVVRSQLHDLSDSDLIVLSTGGNDALSNVDLIGDNVHATPESILARLWTLREEFRAKFVELLSTLTENKRRVLVLTIYNPAFAAYGRPEREQHAAEAGLSLFNDVILQEALARNCAILEMRTLFDEPSFYANPIEPSAKGGARIAERIRDWALAK